VSTQIKPSLVFVHGLWADCSCFGNVIAALEAEGHEVISTQNSLDRLKGDVEAVKRALGWVRSPAVVGHSYGGTAITAAGNDDRVAWAPARPRCRAATSPRCPSPAS
jgi:pimeloyl-ACP methyl ester carboxylesterase